MRALRLQGLSAAYDSHLVLEDVSLDIEEGSLCAIVGPNGAGKSTLLKCILNFVKREKGDIKIFDQELKEALSSIAYVPQQNAVNWEFPITVLEVVLMGRYRRFSWLRKISKAEKEKAYQALEEMNIADLANRQISQLSGGQKQRVFIARALCQEASLYLMDEPLAGVDSKSEEIIMRKCKELSQAGKTVLCVHHDLGSLPQYFRQVVMINRKVVACGEVKDVFKEENIQATYREVEV